MKEEADASFYSILPALSSSVVPAQARAVGQHRGQRSPEADRVLVHPGLSPLLLLTGTTSVAPRPAVLPDSSVTSPLSPSLGPEGDLRMVIKIKILYI